MTALGDPTRRAIFERLAEPPCAVGALARGLPVSRPGVSQHLKVLKEAGPVTDTPVGNRRVYQLDAAGIAELRAYLDHHWNRALSAFKAAAEHRRGGRSRPIREGQRDRGAVHRRRARSHPRRPGAPPPRATLHRLERMRDAVASPDGWGHGLSRFAERADG